MNWTVGLSPLKKMDLRLLHGRNPVYAAPGSKANWPQPLMFSRSALFVDKTSLFVHSYK